MTSFVNLEPFCIIIKKMKPAFWIFGIPGSVQTYHNTTISNNIRCRYQPYSFFVIRIDAVQGIFYDIILNKNFRTRCRKLLAMGETRKKKTYQYTGTVPG